MSRRRTAGRKGSSSDSSGVPCTVQQLYGLVCAVVIVQAAFPVCLASTSIEEAEEIESGSGSGRSASGGGSGDYFPEPELQPTGFPSKGYVHS